MPQLRLSFLLALPLVAACAEMGGGPPRSLALAGGVMATGPQGYCVNPAASKPAAGFAVLGACTLFGAQPFGVEDGLISVQLGEADSAFVTGAETMVASYLRSAEGRASLSAQGRAGEISVEAVEQQGAVVIVRFRDSSRGGLEGMQEKAWRAFFDLKGRAVTLSLRGYARSSLSDAQGGRLLGQAVNALLQANP